MPRNLRGGTAEHWFAVNFQRISSLPQRVFGGSPLRPVQGPSLPLPAGPRASDSFVRVGARSSDPTIPTPLIDLSDKVFNTVFRPDGRPVKIEQWGDIVIPDRLLPGGVEMAPLVLDGTSVVINVFGDTGKGTDDQFLVARNIAAMADKRGARVTAHVGDIIYPSGILDMSDARVRDWLREPYMALQNKRICWGNHEYGNSRAAGVVEAWLDVAKADLPGTFAQPARFYSQRLIVDGMTIRTLYLDTCTLAVDPAQMAWIRSELEKPADMRIVFGHHPVYSGGLHGSLPHMEKLLLPLLENHADLYCCGHEHNLQFLRSGTGFPLVVSGAAGEKRAAWRKPQSEFFSPEMGTTFLTVDRSGIAVEMCNGKTQETLFTTTIARRIPQQVAG